MKFLLETAYHPHVFMKKLGYSANGYGSNELNFVRRARGGNEFPRFHVYLTENGPGKLLADLHIDQKAETRHYKAEHAHNGEYDGPIVEAEKKRILANL